MLHPITDKHFIEILPLFSAIRLKYNIELQHKISNKVVCVTREQSLRSACAFAQSDQSLCLSFEYSMTVKLLTKQHFEFLCLKGGCTGSSESTFVKMSHCWKSHVTAHIFIHLTQ